jgi:hypothetical protein
METRWRNNGRGITTAFQGHYKYPAGVYGKASRMGRQMPGYFPITAYLGVVGFPRCPMVP